VLSHGKTSFFLRGKNLNHRGSQRTNRGSQSQLMQSIPHLAPFAMTNNRLIYCMLYIELASNLQLHDFDLPEINFVVMILE
jgi:hypothetical protein